MKLLEERLKGQNPSNQLFAMRFVKGVVSECLQNHPFIAGHEIMDAVRQQGSFTVARSKFRTQDFQEYLIRSNSNILNRTMEDFAREFVSLKEGVELRFKNTRDPRLNRLAELFYADEVVVREHIRKRLHLIRATYELVVPDGMMEDFVQRLHDKHNSIEEGKWVKNVIVEAGNDFLHDHGCLIQPMLQKAATEYLQSINPGLYASGEYTKWCKPTIKCKQAKVIEAVKKMDSTKAHNLKITHGRLGTSSITSVFYLSKKAMREHIQPMMKLKQVEFSYGRFKYDKPVVEKMPFFDIAIACLPSRFYRIVL